MKALLLMTLFFSSMASARNLHLIEEVKETGFAIYRSGKVDLKDMKELCKLGIEEIAVLSGNAGEHEFKYQAGCPTLKVVYNRIQSAKVPVTTNFLNWFDSWVDEARAKGKKIAFRCNCGCHRTGRLAAYYQMKYQNLSSTDAKVIMKKHGKYMKFYPGLKKQVVALEDYLNNKSCSQKRKHCVLD